MILSSDNPLPVGHELKEYKVQSILGRGGFGVTYLVLDTNLDKLFALKEYFPIAVATRGLDNNIQPKERSLAILFERGRAAFLREARVLAAFKHANIISAIRVFEAHNTVYILMEYEKGRSLQSQLENRQTVFTESEVLSIFLPILEGLEQLHDKGVIHRDIKPDNIFIRHNGTPVLLDFGAARSFLESGGTNMSIILTPHFAPIEQFTSDIPQGPYTDIYALGCVLYYLITGRIPVPSIERARGKKMESAESLKTGEYSDVFLRAIDLSMHLDCKCRPQTLTEWRKLFDPASFHYDLIMPVANIQGKIFDSLRNLVIDEFGLSIILHEAVLFSVVFPLIELEWRLQRHFEHNFLFKVYGNLLDLKNAFISLVGEQNRRSDKIVVEDIDMKSLFHERYRQYSASYLIDREQLKWDYKMTASRFIRNAIPGYSSSTQIPDWLIQYGADILDRQRGRLKRDLQKLDPRWGLRNV